MYDLICRNKAIKAIHDSYDECLNIDEEGAWIARDVESILDDVPNVEAIPISWIYAYIDDIKRDIERNEKLKNEAAEKPKNQEAICRMKGHIEFVRGMVWKWREIAKDWE